LPGLYEFYKSDVFLYLREKETKHKFRELKKLVAWTQAMTTEGRQS
jgi:hypothetical protein